MKSINILLNFTTFFSNIIIAIIILLLFTCSDSKEQPPNDPPPSSDPWNEIVTVNLNEPEMISYFEIGLTHTHNRWYTGHPQAVNRVKKLLKDAKVRYQNTHIMGWGPDNPNPAIGVYRWQSLDNVMDMILSMEGTIPVITFCTAPGWMKRSGNDWDMEDRVSDDHFENFAVLCSKVAERYDYVEYFQVWNELKGFRSWTNGVEKRDMKQFTEMYNLIYDAVKKVRPNAKIGGPYMPLGGLDLTSSHIQDIKYWVENSNGGEFFNYDGWVEGWPPGGNSEEWMMSRSSFFGSLTKKFKDVVDLSQWVSEYYPGRNNNPEFVAAHFASTYYHSLKSGIRLALLWDGVNFGELFSNTEKEDGGQPTLQYNVVSAFNNYFGPGTQLYKTTSTTDDIEVLSSSEKILLINKTKKSFIIKLKDRMITLKGYEVMIYDNIYNI